MTFHNQSIRSIRQVLGDKTGTGMAESLGGIALIMLLTVSITVGITTDLRAVTTIATKAERQAMVAALVGDRNEGATWGSKEAPTTKTVTLENGADVDVTMWRSTTPVGTSLTAVTAVSGDPERAADCSAPADVETSGCVYATRFHAADLDRVEPHAIIRKDPSTATSPTGTVDPRVSTETAIPQGAVIASGADPESTVWRYLLTARSSATSGEVRITQGDRTLATIPVEAINGNYFGTFSAEINVPVTVTVSQGNVVVETVYIYRAGGTL